MTRSKLPPHLPYQMYEATTRQLGFRRQFEEREQRIVHFVYKSAANF